MVIGYCVKCRVKKEVQNPTKKKFRAWMVQGKCGDCGTKMSCMVSQEVADTVEALTK